jgi:hypothetical protein
MRSRPARPGLRGHADVEWGTWSWTGARIIPASLGNEMRAFRPLPGRGPQQDRHGSTARPGGLPPPPAAAVARKAEVVTWLMGRRIQPVPGGVRRVPRRRPLFWHYQDPEYVAYPTDAAESLLRATSCRARPRDRRVAPPRGPDTTVLLVAATAGPNYSGSHVLGHLLARMGLLHDSQLGPAPGAARRGGTNGRVPEHPSRHDSAQPAGDDLQNGAAASGQRALSLRWKTAGIDWQHPGLPDRERQRGYVRLNLVGRGRRARSLRARLRAVR